MQPESVQPRSRMAKWQMIAAVVSTIALITVFVLFTQPLPPRTVILATGPEDSEYYAIGERYREFFARHGMRLKIRPTAGSVSNLGLLADPRSDVSVAIVSSGLTDQQRSPGLVSLGTVFLEPFWLFSRDKLGRVDKSLDGKRISLGEPGSGTYKIARDLAEALGMDLSRMQIRDLDSTAAGEALLRGDLDFVGMLVPWETLIVQRLLRDKTTEIVHWPRADAHVALRPFLSKLVVPRGMADFANDRPPQDVILVASKASVVVRNDLHPAIQYLLLEAASEIHSKPGVFNKAGEFPAAEPIDLPLSDVAREYYRNGQPFLQRYLPFWLAAYTSRLLVLLIPVFGVAYPLFRVLPAMYGWSMRRRIFALYGQLKFLEAEINAGAPNGEASLLAQIEQLEGRANRMRVPVTFAHMLYTLKHHITLVKARMTLTRQNQTGSPAR